MSSANANGKGKGTAETATTNKSNVNANAQKRTTRNDARKTGVAVTTQRTEDDINNAVDGQWYLEKHLLLCPAGEPITTSALASCLHQVLEITRTNGGRTMANAVRAAAFLAEEME